MTEIITPKVGDRIEAKPTGVVCPCCCVLDGVVTEVGENGAGAYVLAMMSDDTEDIIYLDDIAKVWPSTPGANCARCGFPARRAPKLANGWVEASHNGWVGCGRPIPVTVIPAGHPAFQPNTLHNKITHLPERMRASDDV